MDLQAIEARLAAATPGPWKAQDFVAAPTEDAGSAVVKQGNGGLVAYALRSGAVEHEWYDKPQCDADAEFIAHAPADMRALLDEVERLRGQVEAVRAATANHPDPCEKHPDGDTVTCGWKSAYQDVVHALEVQG